MVGLVAGVVKVVKMVSICSGRGLGGLATEGGAGRHGVAPRRNGGDGGGDGGKVGGGGGGGRGGGGGSGEGGGGGGGDGGVDGGRDGTGVTVEAARGEGGGDGVAATVWRQ